MAQNDLSDSYADAESWLERAELSRRDTTPSLTVELYGNAIIKFVASSHKDKEKRLVTVVCDAVDFVISQLLSEETVGTEEEDFSDFFLKSLKLLVTDSDISKKYLTRLLNVKVTDEDIINNYIKEVMTKRALESLIMTELTCSALGAILESRSVREHESPTEERSHVRLHKEIDS